MFTRPKTIKKMNALRNKWFYSMVVACKVYEVNN